MVDGTRPPAAVAVDPSPTVRRAVPAEGRVRQRRVPAARLVAVVAAGAAAYAAAYAAVTSTGSSDAASALISILGVVLPILIAVGPQVRGVRPRRVWWFQAVGSAAFAVAALAASAPASWGALGSPDLWLIVGRVMLVGWLMSMAKYLGRPDYHYVPVLDVVAVTLCVALWMWPLLLAPLIGTPLLAAGLTQTLLLMADATILTMAIEVTYQVRSVTTSHRLLLWGIGLHMLFAPAFAVEAVHPGTIPPIVGEAYVIVLCLLVGAAWHPSVRVFVDKPDKDSGRRPSAGTVSLTMGNTVPTVVAVIAPTHGTLDIAVRVVCIVGLLASLAVRLWGTMRALAAAEADSHYRATHDQLTGLLNRAALFDGLEHVLDGNAAAGRHTAALFFDCDEFKQVNDRWGHHSGDQLLMVIAARMASYPGSIDLMARHGGDEFVVVTTVDGAQEAVALAEWMRSTLEKPVELPDAVSHCPTSSIGIALAAPDTRTTADDVLRWADTAMYVAKSRGHGQYVLAEREPTPPVDEQTPTVVSVPH